MTQIIGVDWNISEFTVFDGKEVFHIKSVEELCKRFPNTRMVFEASVESFILENRDKLIKLLAEYNIEGLTYDSKYTARRRFKLGITDEKDSNRNRMDDIDAKVIYNVATETPLTLSHLRPLSKRDNDPLRESIKKALVDDRRMYEHRNKELLVKKFLPLPKNLTEHADILLNKGDEYRLQVGSLLVVGHEVRKAGRGFREFRRQVGNYSNGYGAIPRSEFYFWLVQPIVNVALGRHHRKGLSGLDSEQRIIQKNIMRKADAAIKWLWQQTISS